MADKLEQLVWTITKLYDKGIEDKRAKPVPVESFSLDIDRGSTAIGGPAIMGKGYRIAMALNIVGHRNVVRVFPDLKNATIEGCYAEGFRVSGFCEEQIGKKFHKCYCEWWVCWPNKEAGTL